MRRPRAGDERASHALGRRRGSAWWPIRAARQELADGAAVEACPLFLAGEAARNDGKPGGYSRQPRIGGNPRSGRRPGKRGPAQAFRLRLWAKRKKTAANEPGHFKDVRVARREALPHFRKEMRILNRRRQRPLARHPLVSGGEKEDRPARGLDKEYGRWRASRRESRPSWWRHGGPRSNRLRVLYLRPSATRNGRTA